METGHKCYTIQPKRNFTIVDNDLILNSDLSSKAFKLLCIGLSRPEKWVFYKSEIASKFKEGNWTVDQAVKELKKLGYLYTIAKKEDDGKFSGHTWFWFAEPKSEEEFKKFLRNIGFPEFGKNRVSEKRKFRKPDTINTNKTSNTHKTSNTEKDNVSERPQKKSTKIQKHPVEKNETEKDNVKRETLPSFSKKKEKSFRDALNDEQKAIHDKLVKYKPSLGDPLKSEDVCAWMLARKYTVQQLEDAFKVYVQDFEESQRRKDPIVSMGAYLFKALKEGRKPRNDDTELNRKHAESKAKTCKFIEVTKRYVKIFLKTTQEEIYFNLPYPSFVTTLESYLRKAALENM